MANNNYAKQLKHAQQTGFNEGKFVGENVMLAICSVALYNCDGYGKTNPKKWERLQTEVQRIYDELYYSDDLQLGFEHLVQALVIIKGEEARPEIEGFYKNLLYKASNNK